LVDSPNSNLIAQILNTLACSLDVLISYQQIYSPSLLSIEKKVEALSRIEGFEKVEEMAKEGIYIALKGRHQQEGIES
jgi:hypothetical protein